MEFGLILDSIKNLASPIPRHLKAMGYVRELTGMASRRKRRRTAWQPHLERTRSVIMEAADLCGKKERALIVGSGLLFDIPLAELSRRFREVVLADILHLRKVRKRAGQYPNVRLEQLDVTGVVEHVYALPRGKGAERLPERKPEFFIEEGFDLVISANLLSQLPVRPNAYLSRRMKGLKNGVLQEFSRRLVENHLDWLASFPGVVCLIADLERLEYDGPKLVSREGSLWGVALPGGGREWLWDLAPRPELGHRFDIRHRVVGFANFPKRAWLDRGSAGGEANA